MREFRPLFLLSILLILVALACSVPLLPGPPVEVTPGTISDVRETETRVRSRDGMVEVYVPAGSFEMGSTSGDDDEAPVHRVMLSAFWIDQTEVTNRMYALCVQAGACKSPAMESSDTRTSYYGNTAYDDYPVIYVSWHQASAYCTWVGGGLPSEAQWEYAARGNDGRTYPWGNDSTNCSLANYSGCQDDTVAVGSYPAGASPFGAWDMAGNVLEWVDDWYGTYPSAAQTDPSGPANGTSRVLRGGSWTDSGYFVRSAVRLRIPPSLTYNLFGFRCARSQ